MTVFLSASIKKIKSLQHRGRPTRDSEVWGSGRMTLAVVHQDDIEDLRGEIGVHPGQKGSGKPLGIRFPLLPSPALYLHQMLQYRPRQVE